MDSQTVAHEVTRHSRRAQRHPLVDTLARVGLVAYGVVYLVLGWLALQVALEDRDGAIDKTGALRQLTDQPLGRTVLWLVVVGLAALTVWQLLEAVTGYFGSDVKEKALMRGRAVVRAAIFAVLAVSAAKVALGTAKRTGTDGWTADLMARPFGPWLVGLVGLAVLAFAAGSAFIGLTDRYQHDLDVDGRTGQIGTALTVLARAGYASRAVAFGLVGALFVWAASTHDPQKSGGLDQALGRLLQAPAGPALLSTIAAGFACYGLFNLAKARHLRN